METPWHLFLMAALYLFGGLMHFIKPRIYLRIMPRFLPNPELLVKLSGWAEIGIAIALCIPYFRNLAIWLLIAMLAIFLWVHFYMLSSKKAGAGVPQWILILRIPLQFVLMYWAFTYVTA
ncbi:hypothetical protein K8352_01555 [Flavobacteriaceae bacterium F89]|uniref:Methylamine utilisation protein MauE domain-containing protein n=1 Tax=Cerina litoralis TaxID=2874477 RepID=A0AAE3ER39_9FLAO|nr:MauE/DoxX family redox-associated membrane protein [Cerina litoralis]MCG2459428.1 hypothetical protein [Cerina litoralis]